jgi:hypothetical protein
MATQSFIAPVTPSGDHPLFDVWIVKFKYRLLCLNGRLVDLPLPKAISRKRSDRQNRYYWGLMGLLEDDTGFTKDELHDMFGVMFRKKIIVIGNEECETIVSTTDYDTDEMSDYIEKIRQYQQVKLPNCYLPTPEEWRKMEEQEY